MKLQQLRYVLEITRQGNHLSAAADALNTSQPGVSRQIQLLEAELGFDIFLRTRNRIIGLTPPGHHVVDIARRVIDDIGALRALKDEVSVGNRGTLTIGTTHTQARYVLPRVIASFVEKYPDVELILKEGDPEEICQMVDAGVADFAIGTETAGSLPHLVKLPCFEIKRSVVAKAGHPILKIKKLSLKDIAAYPIIIYGARHSGRQKVMDAFRKAGIKPTFARPTSNSAWASPFSPISRSIRCATPVSARAAPPAYSRAAWSTSPCVRLLMYGPMWWISSRSSRRP
jgi:LysR family cys regulon transcriptional activator